jgi:hypothetical protein
MIDLATLTASYSQKDTLDALYYAARFIKQASRIQKEYKNIFEEDFRSAPSQSAQELCLTLISAIEAAVGRRAADFDDNLAARVLQQLTSNRVTSRADFTQEEDLAADAAIRSMVLPETKAPLKH